MFGKYTVTAALLLFPLTGPNVYPIPDPVYGSIPTPSILTYTDLTSSTNSELEITATEDVDASILDAATYPASILDVDPVKIIV